MKRERRKVEKKRKIVRVTMKGRKTKKQRKGETEGK